MNEFSFSTSDFIFNLDWKHWEKSPFDQKLETTWLSKTAHFRYNLNITESKILDGDCLFLAQLNIDRALNKRTPECIMSLQQPFCHDKFNFTKVKNEEIMFTLVQKENISDDELEKDFFIINVSPLERCHSLIVPSLYKCQTQIFTQKSLHVAVNTILLSGSPEMRVGFNSLCAYASVNHLHLHTYYLGIPMKLETIEVDHLAGECYTLENFPSKGFVFQIQEQGEIENTIKDIAKLTNFLTDQNIAHNVCLSRGLRFENTNNLKGTTERDCIRIFIWARASSSGSKVPTAFNPAVCELFGHLLIKTKETYDELSEDFVVDILHSITHEPFISIKEKVKDLYKT